MVLEKILPVEEGRRYPVCVAGARHGLLENVGGVSGYEEFLRISRDAGARSVTIICVEQKKTQVGESLTRNISTSTK